MVAAFISGFIVGFIYNWQMSLVMVIFTPFLAMTNAWMGSQAARRTHVEQEKYAVAGAIADETFSSMRTVLALNAGRQEINRFFCTNLYTKFLAFFLKIRGCLRGWTRSGSFEIFLYGRRILHHLHDYAHFVCGRVLVRVAVGRLGFEFRSRNNFYCLFCHHERLDGVGRRVATFDKFRKRKGCRSSRVGCYQ